MGRTLVLGVVTGALAIGCGAPGREGGVVALVAASTGGAIEEIAARWEERTGVRVDVSAGPSSALAAQVRRGAPAGVFLSAHPRWVESLAADGLVSRSATLLGNRLVVVVPDDGAGDRDDPGAARDLSFLAEPAVTHVALADPNVPAGAYADDALRSAGLAGRIAHKVVRASDVRAALAWVERGEADAAIVYATDAAAARDRTRIVHRIDPASHAPIRYALAVVTDAGGRAVAFAEYLRGDEAAAIFARHGFVRGE